MTEQLSHGGLLVSFISFCLYLYNRYPTCDSAGKESAWNAEDPGLIPGLGKYLGEGNGNPLQSSLKKGRLAGQF